MVLYFNPKTRFSMQAVTKPPGNNPLGEIMESEKTLGQVHDPSPPDEDERRESQARQPSPVTIKVVQKPVPSTPRGVLAE